MLLLYAMTTKLAKLLESLCYSSVTVSQSICFHEGSHPRLAKPDIQYLDVYGLHAFQNLFLE